MGQENDFKTTISPLFLYLPTVYDAFGKIGSDVVGGNVNRPGSLQECLLVHGPAFNGQFCQVFLKQVKLVP